MTAVEPMPESFGFETLPFDCDLSQYTVMDALIRMDWQPHAAPVALLLCQPENYLQALEIRDTFQGALEIHVARMPDLHRDAWFVSWRGRHMGSPGA